MSARGEEKKETRGSAERAGARPEAPGAGSTAESGELHLRHPRVSDGAAVWRLARDTGGLDLNTPYAYILFCDRFAGTCIVAEESGAQGGARGVLRGFVVGFVPPDAPEALFVWQVGVDPAARGRRLGSRMLDALAREHAGRGGTHLQATVTPSNAASLRLFRSFSERWHAPCEERLRYRAEDFPGGPDHHEEERLLRIGPFGVRDAGGERAGDPGRDG